MIQIVAWAGAVLALIGGLGMLFMKAPEEKRRQTRMFGLFLLLLVPFNLWLAARVL